MPLRRKIDDVPRAGQKACIENEHLSGAHFVPFTGDLVHIEILRKRLSKLESDSPAHDSNTIHRVDESFGVSEQNVSVFQLNHCALLLVIPISRHNNSRSIAGSFHSPRHALRGLPVNNADSLDQSPWKRLLDQEFRLLPFLNERVSPIGRGDRLPIQHVKLINIAEERCVASARVPIAERPTPYSSAQPFRGGVEIGLKVDDWSLATPISQLWMVFLVKQVKHDR